MLPMMKMIDSEDGVPAKLMEAAKESGGGALAVLEGYVGGWNSDPAWYRFDGDLVIDGDLLVDLPLVVTGDLVVAGVLREACDVFSPLFVGGDLVASMGIQVQSTWIVRGCCVTTVFFQTWEEHESGLIVGRWSLDEERAGSRHLVFEVGFCQQADDGVDDVEEDWAPPPFTALVSDYDDHSEREDAASRWADPFAEMILGALNENDDEDHLFDADGDNATISQLFDDLIDAVRRGQPLLAREPRFSKVPKAAKTWWRTAPEEFLLELATKPKEARKVALRPWPLSAPVREAASATLSSAKDSRSRSASVHIGRFGE